MDKEKKDKLIKYLNKKGIVDIEDDSDKRIDVIYSKCDIKLIIRLYLYPKDIGYETPGETPKYKNSSKYTTYYRKNSYYRIGGDVCRRVGGDNINKLKTKFNRNDFNSAVYKNILLIQTWLDPILEKKKKEKDDLNNYASELEFYFKDKYGDAKLSISGDEIKNILVKVTNKNGATEYHKMMYENGNYFLNSISTFWYKPEKKVYTQRKKVIN